MEVASVEQAKLIDTMNVDFWTDVRSGGNVDIMVAPAEVNNVRGALDKNGIHHFVQIEDVQVQTFKQQCNPAFLYAQPF